MEHFWISENGLHTIKDRGGWGYNLREGGEGGLLSETVIEKMKQSHNKNETLEKHRLASVAQYEREIAIDPEYRRNRAKSQMEKELLEGKKTLAERGNEWWENASDAEKARATQKRKDTIAAHTAERRRQKIEKFKQSMAPIKAVASSKLIATLAERFDAKIAGLSSKQQECMRNKRDAGRRKSDRKKQILAAARMFTGNQSLKLKDAMALLMSGSLEYTDTSSDSKRSATLADKFEAKISGLTSKEQERMRKKRAAEKRKSDRKKRILAAARMFTGNQSLKLKDAMVLLKSGCLEDPYSVSVRSNV
jgi:uncharacterized protein YciW